MTGHEMAALCPSPQTLSLWLKPVHVALTVSAPALLPLHNAAPYLHILWQSWPPAEHLTDSGCCASAVLGWCFIIGLALLIATVPKGEGHTKIWGVQITPAAP